MLGGLLTVESYLLTFISRFMIYKAELGSTGPCDTMPTHLDFFCCGRWWWGGGKGGSQAVE
jgi:hypothetical protein